MKRQYLKASLAGSLVICVTAVFAQNVAINNTGNAARVSAILDLSNNNTAGSVGFLPPYVNLNLPLSTFGLSGTAAQSNGMIIYSTGAGTAPAGLYYWNNTTPSWVAMGGSALAGGTTNYLARWTSATTLGIGVDLDNGVTAAVNATATAPVATQMLTVTGNATAINAILGSSTATGGAGVIGSMANTGGSGGFGVEGTISGSGGGFQYGVYGASSVTAGNGIGVWGQATGGGAAINYGGYFNATGGASNYAVVVPSGGGNSGFNTITPVSTVDDFGSMGTQISASLVTANTTLDGTYSTILANPTSGAFTVTLPAANTCNRRIYTIVYSPSSATANAVTIASASSIFTGSVANATLSLTTGSIQVQSNGGSWYVLNVPNTGLQTLGQTVYTANNTANIFTNSLYGFWQTLSGGPSLTITVPAGYTLYLICTGSASFDAATANAYSFGEVEWYNGAWLGIPDEVLVPSNSGTQSGTYSNIPFTVYTTVVGPAASSTYQLVIASFNQGGTPKLFGVEELNLMGYLIKN